MQRIDEHTYIDETLVTCTEYQLFIDEMREQGKYYQPDHWTSYQFPDGQAREPILGVRYSDAVTFCEWLTNRENDRWQYRLPSLEEATAFLIKFTLSKGYWLSSRVLYLLMDGRGSTTNSVVGELEQVSTLIQQYAGLAYGFYTLDFPHPLDQDLLRSAGVANELNGFLVRTEIGIGMLEGKTDLLQAIRLAEDLNFSIPDILERVLRLANEVNWSNRPDIMEARQLLQSFEGNLSDSIVLFQERIGGRSPAFEGIRLVKERIK